MSEPLERIESALKRLGAEHEPPPGWESRVLAAVAAERRSRPWWMFAAPGVALAAAAAVAVVALLPSRPRALALNVEVTQQEKTRGEQVGEARVGDTVHLTVSGGDRHHALRVYRDERELVFQCPGGPTCRSSDDGLIADLKVSMVGTYRIFALSASAPLPEPTGNFDADLAAMTRAKVTPKERQLYVR